MTEPVLQGLVSRDSTQVIVMPPSETSAPASRENGHLEIPLRNDSREGTSSYDVAEDFLAATLLDGLDGEPIASRGHPRSTSELPDGSEHSLSPHAKETGRTTDCGRTLQATALQERPIAAALQPRPPVDEDEHIQAFVRTSDLGRLGIFSGDLVEVSSSHTSSDRRNLRLYGNDSALSHLSASTPMPIALSPITLHNMGSPKTISLRLAVQRPGETFFPTADAITIARVASEHSMHKRYQPIFLEGLKAFFQERRRILKQGDLIAIPIDDALARFTEDVPEGEESAAASGEQDAESFELLGRQTGHTAVAYFQVSQLEAGGEGLEDLGSAIDPANTSMIQTGLETTSVPDTGRYLQSSGPQLSARLVDELGKSTNLARFLDYLQAARTPRSNALDLTLSVLLRGARGSGKSTLARWSAQRAGYHLFELDCYDLLGETDIKTEGNLLARVERAAACTPCVLLLKHIEGLARKSQAVETGQESTISAALQQCLQTAQESWKLSGKPLVIVGTTSDPDKIPISVLGCFKEEISIEAPGEAERLSMLQTIFGGATISPDVSFRAIAVQTAALVARDLVDLATRTWMSATERLTEAGLDLEDCRAAGISLLSADFNRALDASRSSYSESIGAPKIPNVTWDDVGGLAKVKSEILDTIQLPLEHPELFADGLKKRSGVLLYGPPGTGKTLLAKAVATSCSLNFFSVKGPELLNMYIGESEANVRRVFQRARDAKPCVIFFDELDSVAPKRGNQGDSGGVMDRIVSQLLAELDGMAEGSAGADVFVIGATNRPDLLDPALLRPGRFDRMLYLGVSDTHEAQYKIIEALTRKFKLDQSTDLRRVAELCPFNYTGADFYALCSDAMLKAMSRKAEDVDQRIAELNATPEYADSQLTPQYYLAELATASEIEILVSQRDFEAALSELVPSVSAAEMEHYRVVQQKFNPTSADGPAPTDVQHRKGKGKARAE